MGWEKTLLYSLPAMNRRAIVKRPYGSESLDGGFWVADAPTKHIRYPPSIRPLSQKGEGELFPLVPSPGRERGEFFYLCWGGSLTATPTVLATGH